MVNQFCLQNFGADAFNAMTKRIKLTIPLSIKNGKKSNQNAAGLGKAEKCFGWIYISV
jgi:hypothetical protein